MSKTNKPKSSSYAYGKEWQKVQRSKYYNRNNNHWKFKIKKIMDLISKYSLPRLGEKEKKNVIVVDVGCSIGTFAIELAKQGYRSYGIDFDTMALRLARELCNEEKVSVEFVCGDVSDWDQTFPTIDIAVCADVFEHLHDDELGSFLSSIKKQLSKEGSLVFHTFPTQYDYLFYGKSFFRFPLIPFKFLSPSRFNKVVFAYAALIDIVFLIIKGSTYKEYIKYHGHCNPLTKERLTDIFIRAGYKVVYMETSQLYPFQQKIQNQFNKHHIVHRNLYGVVKPSSPE